MKFDFMRLLVICFLTLPTISHSETKIPEAVSKIDIQKYVGKWYEIAHIPMYFQRKCVANTTAQYSINPNNTLSVLNSCRTSSNEVIAAKGIAYPQNTGNSKLKVSFLPKGLRWVPFTKGDYWILRIDPDYKVALIGGPTNEYLWILSRTPTIDEAIYKSYLETAEQYGYDISKLNKTPQ
ncbi:hypothetical protein B9T31_12355 [Acinetobacter sp. ANC 4558]|uniref:lipocalin family protein n=1 Tax=Acinetobacter sp. ANC 4558 TaxID=1977876 RepID=UPI000B749892|nr:hypothetical protein B9T31_12355 [Acinetobacter sp. ANC 4558]